MKEETNFDDLFADESTKPESNWFNFEKIGDAVQGEITMEPYDHEGKYGSQKIYPIKTSEGKEFLVSLKHTTHKYSIKQLAGAKIGDIVAFKLKDLIETDYGNPAKAIEVRIRRV